MGRVDWSAGPMPLHYMGRVTKRLSPSRQIRSSPKMASARAERPMLVQQGGRGARGTVSRGSPCREPLPEARPDDQTSGRSPGGTNQPSLPGVAGTRSERSLGPEWGTPTKTQRPNLFYRCGRKEAGSRAQLPRLAAPRTRCLRASAESPAAPRSRLILPCFASNFHHQKLPSQTA